MRTRRGSNTKLLGKVCGVDVFSESTTHTHTSKTHTQGEGSKPHSRQPGEELGNHRTAVEGPPPGSQQTWTAAAAAAGIADVDDGDGE